MAAPQGRGQLQEPVLRLKAPARQQLHVPDRQHRPGIGGRQQEAQQGAGHRDRVGDDLLVGVDQRRDQHQPDQHQVAPVLGVEHGHPRGRKHHGQLHRQEGLLIDLPPVQPREPQPHEQFDEHRPDPEPGPEKRRLAPQAQPAEHRDAVGGASRRGVGLGLRPGADPARAPGQPVDRQVGQTGGTHAQHEQRHQPHFHRNGQKEVHAGSLASGARFSRSRISPATCWRSFPSVSTWRWAVWR